MTQPVSEIAGTSAADTAEIASRPLFRLGHQPAMDGFRGVAILLVIAYHLHLKWGARGGFIGVDLFFVLSGFLITALMLQERDRYGSVDFRRFYLRRALRLLPAVIVMLTAFVCLGQFFPAKMGSILKEATIALFYASNWVRAFQLTPMTLMGHTWSLSVEEQFYIVWPVLFVLLIGALSRRSALVIVILGAILASTWRAALTIGDVPSERTYNGLDTRADALLIGCALAIALESGWLRMSDVSRKWAEIASVIGIIVVGVVVVVGRSYDADWLNIGGYTVIALSAAAILLSLYWFPDSSLARFLKFAPLIWIGQLSYGLYLWHYPVFKTIRLLTDSRAMVYLGIPITFACAAVSYYAVERPLLRIKDRFKR